MEYVGSWDEELRNNETAAETASDATDFIQYDLEGDEPDDCDIVTIEEEIYDRFGCELSLIADVTGMSIKHVIEQQIDAAEFCEIPVCHAIKQAFEQSLDSLGNPGCRAMCPSCGGDSTVRNEFDDGSHCVVCGARWTYPED